MKVTSLSRSHQIEGNRSTALFSEWVWGEGSEEIFKSGGRSLVSSQPRK